MTRPTPRTRGAELLLARISAAAGRAHLGRRRATYAGAAHPAHPPAGPVRVVRGLLAFVRYGRFSGTTARVDARLDLYEHGMTVVLKGRIRVIRYDTTSVFQESVRPAHDAARGAAARAWTLTDVEGRRIVLYGGPGDGDAEEWGSEIERAVTRARLPQAWAALDKGGRLTFGDLWLTAEKVGSAEVSARWPQVRRIERKNDAIRLNIDGNWHRLGPTASTVPNLFVFCTLVERFHADGVR